jgi:signal peptidase II
MINKKIVLLTALLMIIDQGVKVVIFTQYMGVELVFIPNVLYFEPVQNIHLNYFGSLLGYKMPMPAVILFNIMGFTLVLGLTRYCLFLTEKHNNLPRMSLAFGTAGIFGALIDSVFWGGSIDFILLFDWFTFDMKDVYLNIVVALIVLYMLFYTPQYNRLSKEDRNKCGIMQWIKHGCPIKPIV